jgi:hypothetical protein
MVHISFSKTRRTKMQSYGIEIEIVRSGLKTELFNEG